MAKDLPKVEDWKAPWEVDDDGKDVPADDQKIDKDRLKKYLHGLLSDKVRLRASLDETTKEKEELQDEIGKVKDPKEFENLQAQNAQLIKERDAAKTGSGLQTLRLEIALDKGLTKRQAARLVGNTREELEEDAEELLKEFGGATKGKGGKDDDRERDEGGRYGPRSGPRRSTSNAGDPDDEDGEFEHRRSSNGKETPEDVVKRALSGSRIG